MQEYANDARVYDDDACVYADTLMMQECTLMPLRIVDDGQFGVSHPESRGRSLLSSLEPILLQSSSVLTSFKALEQSSQHVPLAAAIGYVKSHATPTPFNLTVPTEHYRKDDTTTKINFENGENEECLKTVMLTAAFRWLADTHATSGSIATDSQFSLRMVQNGQN